MFLMFTVLGKILQGLSAAYFLYHIAEVWKLLATGPHPDALCTCKKWCCSYIYRGGSRNFGGRGGGHTL